MTAMNSQATPGKMSFMQILKSAKTVNYEEFDSWDQWLINFLDLSFSIIGSY